MKVRQAFWREFDNYLLDTARKQVRAKYDIDTEDGFIGEIELAEAFYFRWSAAGKPMDTGDFYNEDPILWHDVMLYKMRFERQYETALKEWKAERGIKDFAGGNETDDVPTLNL